MSGLPQGRPTFGAAQNVSAVVAYDLSAHMLDVVAQAAEARQMLAKDPGGKDLTAGVFCEHRPGITTWGTVKYRRAYSDPGVEHIQTATR